ncbi:MAG: AgmX/PglI C-terminal domain-containing protein [Archangium sp.]
MGLRVARIWWGERLVDQFVLGDGEELPAMSAGLRAELINDVEIARAGSSAGAWREFVIPAALSVCFLVPLAMPFIPASWSPADFGRATFRAGTVDLGRRVRPVLLQRASTATPHFARTLAASSNHFRPKVGDTAGISGIGTTSRDGHVGPYGRLPIIDGPLTPEMIRRVIREHKHELTECYESAQEMSASVSMKFTIGPDGATRDIEAPACVSRHLRTWTFPRPKGGGSVIVSFPLRFAQK